jgi:hypothetical protein
MDIIKNSIKVLVNFPKQDLTDWEHDKREITVTTELNPLTNNFVFKCRIPTFVFDALKDTDDKYMVTIQKPERGAPMGWQSKPKKFVQQLSSPMLASLLDDLDTVFVDSMRVKERNTAETEKYIAVSFSQSHSQRRDSFNFASMGFNTTSSFQFFVLYKAIKNPNSLDRYNFKTREQINGNVGGINNAKPDGWYWYSVGIIEKNFKLIKWTQEREDFLTSVQTRFVEMNQKLEGFLGDIDDDKIMELMNNSQFLLGSKKDSE